MLFTCIGCGFVVHRAEGAMPPGLCIICNSTFPDHGEAGEVIDGYLLRHNTTLLDLRSNYPGCPSCEDEQIRPWFWAHGADGKCRECTIAAEDAAADEEREYRAEWCNTDDDASVWCPGCRGFFRRRLWRQGRNGRCPSCTPGLMNWLCERGGCGGNYWGPREETAPRHCWDCREAATHPQPPQPETPVGRYPQELLLPVNGQPEIRRDPVSRLWELRITSQVSEVRIFRSLTGTWGTGKILLPGTDAPMTLSSEDVRIVRERFGTNALDSAWGNAVEIEKYTDAVKAREEARESHCADLRHSLRLPEFVGLLQPLLSLQGVKEATLERGSLCVRLEGFNSTVQTVPRKNGDTVAGHPDVEWKTITLNGKLLLKGRVMSVTETSAAREDGTVLESWPNVNRTTLCLGDAGGVMLEMSLKNDNVLEGMMGVITQLRSLANLGFVDGFQWYYDLWPCGNCRKEVPKPELAATGQCASCLQVCQQCGAIGFNDRELRRGRTQRVWLHDRCAETCERCGSVVTAATGRRCTLCMGHALHNCASCGRSVMFGATATMETVGFIGFVDTCINGEFVHYQCIRSCTRCGKAKIHSSSEYVRCKYCRRQCVQCGETVDPENEIATVVPHSPARTIAHYSTPDYAIGRKNCVKRCERCGLHVALFVTVCNCGGLAFGPSR